jgi:hypothetical protein
MKKLLSIPLFLMLFTSCKKETTHLLKKETIQPAVSSFSFGVSHGYCIGECAKFYSIVEEQIFPDDMQRLQQPLLFKPEALSNEKYLIAKTLVDSFPAYLIDNPDTTFGCPDCYDQGVIYLELKNDEGVKYWIIDMDEKGQPSEIRDYIQQLKVVLSQL